MMTAINKIIAVARAEVGYIEKATSASLYSKTNNAGNKNYTKYGYEMHKIYPATMDYPAAWCDAFVDWCFVQAFGSAKAAELLHGFDDYTVNSAQKFKNNGEWHTMPQAGDQIFFKNSGGGICHTGLVTAVSGGKVYTIEGNTSSAAGVVANGGAVAEKVYRSGYNRIAGYGRPDYSIIESEELSMTQYEELKAELKKKDDIINLMGQEIEELKNKTKYHNKLSDVPEWYRPAVKQLIESGGIEGDDNGNLMLTPDLMRTLAILKKVGII